MQHHRNAKDKEQQQYMVDVVAAWRGEDYDTPHAFSEPQEGPMTRCRRMAMNKKVCHKHPVDLRSISINIHKKKLLVPHTACKLSEYFCV